MSSRYPMPGEDVKRADDAPWWKGSPWASHEAALVAARRAFSLSPGEQSRRTRLRRYMEFYGGAERYVVSLDRSPGAIAGGVWEGRGRVGLNVCRSVVDTAVSLMARVKTKATVVTIDGDWGLRRKARQVDMFARGHLAEAEWYERQPQVACDAMVGDIGLVATSFEGGKVVTERVPQWEIAVPTTQARTGRPLEYFRARPVDRNALEAWALNDEWAPDLRHKERMKDAIRSGPVPRAEDMFVQIDDGTGSGRDMIMRWDAWRLGTNGKPGRHVVFVDGATLRDEEWDTERAPVRPFYWNTPLIGFFGTGIIEMIFGIQQELNYTASAIRDAHHLVGKGRWFIPRTARVNEQHLKDNRVTAFTYFDGSAPPQYVSTHPVSAEMYRELENLARRAYEQSGVNQMVAQAEKASGVTSGIAIKRTQDLQSRRFADAQNRYEQLTLGVIDDAIDEARRALSKHGAYKVKAVGSNGVTLVDMKAIDLERDKYVLQIMPTNALSDEPAQRIDDVLTLTSLNVISDQQQLLELLQIPDTEGFVKVKTAPLRYATWLIEKLYQGERVGVDPRAPLDYVEPLLLAAYLNAITDGSPDEIRTNIGDAIDAARARAKQAQRAAQAEEMAAQAEMQGAAAPPGATPAGGPPGPPPGMPPGAPGMPPGPQGEPGAMPPEMMS